MKKTVFIGIAVVAVGVALWIGLRGSDLLATKNTKNHDKKSSVDSVSSSGAGGLNESVKSAQSVDSQEAVYSEEHLSDPVKTLLGLGGGKQNYNSLEGSIGKLSKDLSTDDVAALRDMLTWPNDKFPEGMRPIEINAVKNDVLDRLLRQTELPEGIGLQMVEMASNPENDPVWRDYCIQFMQPFYERASGETGLATKNTKRHENGFSSVAGGENEFDELEAVRDLMVSALDERDGTLAGTSLIGLELLSRTHDEFDREAIVNSALNIAADESASASCRLTALRLSSDLATKNTKVHEDESSVSSSAERSDDNLHSQIVSEGDGSPGGEINTQVAETARLLAQTGETVLLRSAAIVTLGEVGSNEDRELLESYTTSDNKQIADAAKLALQKMDAPDVPVLDRSIPTTVSETTTPPPKKEAPILIN